MHNTSSPRASIPAVALLVLAGWVASTATHAQKLSQKLGDGTVKEMVPERAGGSKPAFRVPDFLTDELPRVSGLSVTSTPAGANGNGYDVDLDITMTTTRSFNSAAYSSFFGTTFYFRPPSVAQLGDLSSSFGFVTRPETVTGANILFTAAAANTTNATISTDFAGIVFDVTGTAIRTFAAFDVYANAVLPLPAVDYGDGDTLSQLTMTQPSGTVTTTPAPGRRNLVRRWRASLTHTYPDLSNYNVRVASTCCSPGVDTNTIPRGTQAATGTLRTTSVFATNIFAGTGDVLYATGGFNQPVSGSFTNTQTGGVLTLLSSTPFTITNYRTSFGTSTFPSTGLDQVTASVVASPNILAIPTVGSLGLIALAMLLAGFGVVLLRS